MLWTLYLQKAQPLPEEYNRDRSCRSATGKNPKTVPSPGTKGG